MSTTARLGAFVVTALLILSAGIFVVGNKRFVFSRTYRLAAPFDNVAGLDEGAAVRAGGVRIGTVGRILLPGEPEDKITVEMQLEDSTRSVLRSDSIASIETEGLLGKKYVAIAFGSGRGQQLRDGDIIGSRPPFDYGDLARRAGEMIDTTKDVIGSFKVGVGNINEASDNLKSITGKISSGQGTVGALVNDRAMYSRLNGMLGQATAGFSSFRDDMDALKHSSFLKGFFESRGYFDSTELTRYAIQTLPRRTPLRTFTFDGKDLFEPGDSAKLRAGKMLDEVGAFLQGSRFAVAVVEAQTSPRGSKEDNLKLSRARATVVRQYLVQKFTINDSRIRTLGLSEDERAATDSGGTVMVVVYPPGRSRRAVEAKTR
jgi:outer membrane protein OmpA-like peptidoglycan-associated protein